MGKVGKMRIRLPSKKGLVIAGSSRLVEQSCLMAGLKDGTQAQKEVPVSSFKGWLDL